MAGNHNEVERNSPNIWPGKVPAFFFPPPTALYHIFEPKPYHITEPNPRAQAQGRPFITTGGGNPAQHGPKSPPKTYIGHHITPFSGPEHLISILPNPNPYHILEFLRFLENNNRARAAHSLFTTGKEDFVAGLAPVFRQNIPYFW